MEEATTSVAETRQSSTEAWASAEACGLRRTEAGLPPLFRDTQSAALLEAPARRRSRGPSELGPRQGTQVPDGMRRYQC